MTPQNKGIKNFQELHVFLKDDNKKNIPLLECSNILKVKTLQDYSEALKEAGFHLVKPF